MTSTTAAATGTGGPKENPKPDKSTLLEVEGTVETPAFVDVVGAEDVDSEATAANSVGVGGGRAMMKVVFCPAARSKTVKISY